MADIGLLGNGRRTSTTSTSTPDLQYTCHTGDNRKLCVAIQWDDSDSITTVEYNGVTLYEVDGTYLLDAKVEWWFLDEEDFPSTPGEYTVEVFFTGSVRATITVLELENTAISYDTIGNASGTSGFAIALFTPTVDDCWAVFTGCLEVAGTLTATTGTTVYSDSLSTYHEYICGYKTGLTTSTNSVRINGNSGYDLVNCTVVVSPPVNDSPLPALNGINF